MEKLKEQHWILRIGYKEEREMNRRENKIGMWEKTKNIEERENDF